MTDLTEQFEKDKLAKGTYYCRSKLDGHKCLAVIRYDGELYDADYNGTLNKGYWEVLAEVPSYEKWQAKLEENAQLKELLKEANNWIKAFYAYETSEFVRKQVKDCLDKISRTLGEDK